MFLEQMLTAKCTILLCAAKDLQYLCCTELSLELVQNTTRENCSISLDIVSHKFLCEIFYNRVLSDSRACLILIWNIQISPKFVIKQHSSTGLGWSCMFSRPNDIVWPGDHFINATQLLNFHLSMRYMYIFQCMGKLIWVKFQRVHLKVPTKCLTHTSEDTIFILEILRTLKT